MPQLSENSIQILDGAVTLTKRTNSSFWQARYKVADNWIRATTNTKDLKEAKAVAEDIYLNAKYKSKNNLPIVSKRFDAIARLTKNKMQAALKAKQCKKVYADYVRVIDKYLIPFFGKHYITNISYALIQQYSDWLNEQFGRTASASAMNTHNSTLNKIFEEAMLHSYMTKAQVPQLINNGRKSERRSDFTLEEYKQLIEFMRIWVKQTDGKRDKSVEMRELLRDYVLILVNTGMRHGTESYGLKWKHLSWYDANGEKVLMISVDGKTNQRELVARHNCTRFFMRIHDRANDLQDYTFNELINAGVDKYVFRLSDGTRTTNLGKTFAILMRDSGLLKDRRTNTNRSLYSLRHTYTTFALLYENLDYFALEKQLGTSAEMIRKYYSHVITRQLANKLVGKNFAKLKEEKKKAVEKEKAMQLIRDAE
jgi:integrase